MAKTRVLIVDDHAVLAVGLRMLIGAQPDMEVVGEAGDGRRRPPAGRGVGPGRRDDGRVDARVRGDPGGRAAAARVPADAGGGPDDARRPGVPARGVGGRRRRLRAEGGGAHRADRGDPGGVGGRTFVDPHLAGDLLQSLSAAGEAAPAAEAEGPDARLSERERAVLGGGIPDVLSGEPRHPLPKMGDLPDCMIR
jgi:hypothetical protein